MKDEEYAYAVSYVKALENRLEEKAGYDSLDELDAFYRSAYNEVKKLLGDNSELYVLLFRNDFFNLKAILKAVFSRTDWQRLVISPSNIEPSIIYNAVKSENFDSIPIYLRFCAKKAYELLSENCSFELLEIYIDNEWQRAVLKNSDGFLKEYFSLLTALISFKTLWRCVLRGKSADFTEELFGIRAETADDVKALILKEFQNADVGNIKSFELWCEKSLEELLDNALKENFSSSPILAFLIKTELRKVGLRRALCTK